MERYKQECKREMMERFYMENQSLENFPYNTIVGEIVRIEMFVCGAVLFRGEARVDRCRVSSTP
jgi:hypothetical protein